ncbi:hypothetical protein BVRB_2g034440 [Beta vulgaris subsp. vulgaris]|nr:hypothetical protein BVRB_2g034440 [Beta vulgaris subsp. vulgaris]
MAVEIVDIPPKPLQSSTTTINTNDDTTATNDDEPLTKPLPPPPAAAKLEFGEPTGIKKSKKPSTIDKSSSLQNYISKGSRRKLSSSISMKMSMKIKDKASDFKDKASDFKDKASDHIKDKASDIKDKASDFGHRKTKHDQTESLWTKRIILGGKCRLPNEDNDDDDDEVISYDDEHGSNSVSNQDSMSSVSQEEKLTKDIQGKGKENVEFDDEDDS